MPAHSRSRSRFQRARCLVTGASSGLGRAIALELASRGAKLALTGRNVASLENTRNEAIARGVPVEQVLVIPADLTVEADRERLLGTVRDAWGGLEIAVQAAGVGAYGQYESHGPDVLRAVMEVNFFAVAELARGLLDLLRMGDDPSMVVIGSIVARRGLPGRPEYSASKFAVAGFVEALRAEWSKYFIHVGLVNPGFTSTDFEKNLHTNTARTNQHNRRTARPEDVAVATLRTISKRRNETVLTLPGRTLLLVNRLLPRLVDRGFDRFIRKLYPEIHQAERARRTAGA